MLAGNLLRITGLAIALSMAAPAVLAASGVVDRDLLLVVFLPSVFVGVVTAICARHATANRKSWVVESRRMP